MKFDPLTTLHIKVFFRTFDQKILLYLKRSVLNYWLRTRKKMLSSNALLLRYNSIFEFKKIKNGLLYARRSNLFLKSSKALKQDTWRRMMMRRRMIRRMMMRRNMIRRMMMRRRIMMRRRMNHRERMLKLRWQSLWNFRCFSILHLFWRLPLKKGFGRVW